MGDAMENSTVEQRVVAVVHEVLRSDPAKITPQSRIKDDLGADSLDQVSLIMALEDQLKITITDEEASALLTVGDAVKFIETKLTAQPS
jgi:acyl carrier protein